MCGRKKASSGRPHARDVNPVPRLLLALAGVVLVDMAVAAAAALLGTSAFAAALQLAFLVTGLVLVIGGISLGGSLRNFPSAGSYGSSPVLATSWFSKAQVEDRARRVAERSNLPVVGVVYGFLLLGLATFLNFLA